MSCQLLYGLSSFIDHVYIFSCDFILMFFQHHIHWCHDARNSTWMWIYILLHFGCQFSEFNWFLLADKILLEMGCFLSTPKDTGGNRRRPANIGDVSVFVPGLRIPKPVDFSESLGDHLSKSLVERLSALRTRIVVMAGQEAPTITRTRRKTATQHG